MGVRYLILLLGWVQGIRMLYISKSKSTWLCVWLAESQERFSTAVHTSSLGHCCTIFSLKIWVVKYRNIDDQYRCHPSNLSGWWDDDHHRNPNSNATQIWERARCIWLDQCKSRWIHSNVIKTELINLLYYSRHGLSICKRTNKLMNLAALCTIHCPTLL